MDPIDFERLSDEVASEITHADYHEPLSGSRLVDLIRAVVHAEVQAAVLNSPEDVQAGLDRARTAEYERNRCTFEGPKGRCISLYWHSRAARDDGHRFSGA